MKRRLKIAPSMGCCELLNLEEQVKFIDERADFLHMDIKDGYYVPTFGIGPDFIASIKDIVTKPMDAHLMVEEPQNFIKACAEAGVSFITPHTDCIEKQALVTINKIKEVGCKAGIALNPATPLENIEYYLPYLDKVTIMLVDAGISGQPVIPEMYNKIRTLVQWRKEKNLHFLIEADGSMNRDLYANLYRAGADIVVLGPPALWNKHPNLKCAWEIMEEELEEETSNI